MVQWLNILQNNNFVNLMRLLLLCEKTGAIALAQLGLTTGWQGGRQNAAIFGDFQKYILNETWEI